MESQLTAHNRRVETDVLARQGLRLPAITLKCLRTAGIYCQPSISIEHQHLARGTCFGESNQRGGRGGWRVRELRR